MRQEKEINKKYTIEQLSELTGYSRRTIRYYVEEGLIDSPAGRGKGGFYFDSHINKLGIIKQLQERGMSLSAISAYLKQNAVPGQRYYGEQAYLSADSRISGQPFPGARDRTGMMRKKIFGDSSNLKNREPEVNEIRQDNIFFDINFSEEPLYCAAAPQPQRDVWVKYEISPGFEINARREFEQEHKKKIEDIIKIARQILGKDPG
jgi:DNA-binding transcriptional MerR regulator